mmetsp:Transcript_5858/g.24659  ORF Transcript_5858/g.24659 Transcript_5858/m.24659 type:complete len:241 (+) Transcript_5858:603-1325(+)
MALGRGHGHRILLHGGGMGRLRLRPQHDRRPRRRPLLPRPLLLQPPQGVLTLLPHRHLRRPAGARRRAGAPPLPRADGPGRRVRPLPGARGRAHLRPLARNGRGRGDVPPRKGLRRHRRGRRRRGGRRLAHRLLRPALLPRTLALRAAHPHRQPPRRLRRGAPARQRRRLLALPPLHVPRRPPRLLRHLGQSHGRQVLHRPLLPRGILLLRPHEPPHHPHRPRGGNPRRLHHRPGRRVGL